MSKAEITKFKCDQGHVFEPSIFGVAQCPQCGSTNFWPDGERNSSKKVLFVMLGLTTLLGAAGAAAWYLGLTDKWFGSTGEIFLTAEQDIVDPCTFHLSVKQLPDSSNVTAEFFRYSKGRERPTNKRTYCWSEGGKASFRAVRRDPEMYVWLNGDSTITLETPGSIKLNECGCFGPPPTPELCASCGFNPEDPDFSISRAPVECVGNEPVFMMGFNREACATCNRDWYVKSGGGQWTQGNTLSASGATVYNLYATYGTDPNENQEVEFFENNQEIAMVDCSPTNLPTRSEIEQDLPSRFNAYSKRTTDESIENYVIPGSGRVIIVPDRVEFKLNNKKMSFRQFQNDLMMLDRKVTRAVVSETSSAGYATEVSKLEVSVQ